jgi:hypothetical protein
MTLRVDHQRAEYFTRAMRRAGCLLLGVTLLVGCGVLRRPSWGSNGVPPTPVVRATNGPSTDEKVTVVPETGLEGKVIRVNESARFAVLNFQVGGMPVIGQELDVFRHGLKVAEVKVTGPESMDNTVGDITQGDAQVGDEIRSH